MSKVITGAVGAMNILAGGREIGDATSVTLPDIERPTTEIKGAGIMGTFAMPISGQVNAMTASVAVRAANADKRYLVGNNVDLEIRFAFDCRASDGTLFVAGTKIFLRGHTTSSFRSARISGSFSSKYSSASA